MISSYELCNTWALHFNSPWVRSRIFPLRTRSFTSLLYEPYNPLLTAPLALSLNGFTELTPKLAVLLTSLLLSLPLYLVNGYSTLLDSPIRTTLNGSFIESYSFWWTSLTYLPSFFFLFLASLFIVEASRTEALHLPLYLIAMSLVYWFEVADYTPLNTLDLTTSYSNYGLNRLLTNTLNKYHPFIFYFSVCALFSSFWIYVLKVAPAWNPFRNISILNYWGERGWLVVLVNLCSLFMGSWWALQEGTWGGWWNWDSSEVLGLEVSLTALALNHSYYRIQHFEKFLVRFTYLIFILIISYFFIQLNFELVSHNFGAKFFFFFNNNLFSIEVILGLTFAVFYTFWFYFYSSETELTLLRRHLQPAWTRPLTTFKVCLPLLLTLWLFFGYKPLMNYFSWNFLGLNLFNYESSIQTTNSLILIGLLLGATTRKRHSIILMTTLVILSTNWVWFLLGTFSLLTLPVRIHTLLTSFAALNLTLSDLSPVYWFTQTPYFEAHSLCDTSWVSELSVAADAYSWDVVKGTATLSTRTVSNWDTMSLMNTPSTNFFSLKSYHSLCLNDYELGSSYTTAYLEFQLPLTPTLALAFLLGSFYLLRLRYSLSATVF